MTDTKNLLSSTDMARFVAEGYLRFDSLISDELSDRVFGELPKVYKDVWKQGGTPLSKMWPNMALSEMIANPRVQGIIQSLIGNNPRYDHHASHVVAAKQYFGANLHQDCTIDPRNLGFDISISFFGQDVTPEMGGTLFVPGSHYRKVHESEIRRYQHVRGQIQTVCPKGTVVFWHHNLWHSSRSNHTDTHRFMLKVRLNATESQCLRWNTSDLEDAETRKKIVEILARTPAFAGVEGRLEELNRIGLWRYLSKDPDFDYTSYMTRWNYPPAVSSVAEGG